MDELRSFVFTCSDEEDKVEKILTAVKKLKRDGFKGEEIVILQRNMALGVYIETAFKKKGIEDVLIKSIHDVLDERYEAVFILGMEEGIFPHGGKSLDKERDLFFKGVCAAKRIIVLSYMENRLWYGERKEREKSRFIDELRSIVRAVWH